MIRFISILALVAAIAVVGTGPVQAAPVASPPAKSPPAAPRATRSRPARPRVIPLPPTSPAWDFGPGFPQPPTPIGNMPITTYRWPFAMLPYYYAPPRQDTSPDTRYLLSPLSDRTFHIHPLIIPDYTPPYYQILPPNAPLY